MKEIGSNSMERRGFLSGILAAAVAPLALFGPRPRKTAVLLLTTLSTVSATRRRAVWKCVRKDEWQLIPVGEVRLGDRLLLPPSDGRKGVLAERRVLLVRHAGPETFVAMTQWDRHNEEYWPESTMREMGFGDGGTP